MLTSTASIEAIPALVQQLYAIVAEFERLFPGRRFTPDGHLVGSIGEVLAAHRYRLTLHAASAASHDAVAPNGWLVQVKATQGTTVALRSEPQHLLVLHLGRVGQVSEVFNGPRSVVWACCGRMQRNSQRPVSLARLRALMTAVPTEQRLPSYAG